MLSIGFELIKRRRSKSPAWRAQLQNFVRYVRHSHVLIENNVYTIKTLGQLEISKSE